ncbi:ABC transporter substrate-binding protein [Uliginosibacterium flavum]|uniref:ABC transporter substrate-binding protein n=1 Tax=Uliginosibacterium flavum TaxID=1396831 RepID=A0ABV2TGU1_9RHOO
MRFHACCLVPTLALLAACVQSEPIKLGFIGGVSGRFADLGTAGRNGAQLAVEWRNQAGGIKGRQVNLLVRDDRQDDAGARDAVRALAAEGVSLIVGPMTSSVAVAALPEAQAAGLVIIGGTVTTTRLSGKDDNFFRVVSSTSVYGRSMADFQRNTNNLSHAAVLVDLANRDYTLSWLEDYRLAFEQAGGKIVAAVEFDSRQSPDYGALAQQLLKSRPDVISLVCNTVDAGMLAQKIRQQNNTVQIAGAGWAATERLIELGGVHAEGMLVEQYFDRNDASANYLKFREAYLKRFGQEPGYASVAGFDAANVALDVLSRTDQRKEIKAELLRRKTFQALQGQVVFDAFGDASRPQFMTVVRNARFEAQH